MKGRFILQNGRQNKFSELARTKKVVQYLLLSIIYISFFTFQLTRIQAISNFNYRLHEILYLPFNVAMFLVPVVFLVYMYLVIKCLIKKANEPTGFIAKLKGLLVFISVLAILAIVGYQMHEVKTGGIFEVKDKVQEESKYYLILEDKRISVSRNEFNLINAKESYLISFVWNSLSPEKGKLINIEPF